MLCLGLLFTAPASGQQEMGAFGESIDVNLVNLEVRVTLDGQPLSGLGPEDFEILDDGVRMKPTHFQAVQGLDSAIASEAESLGTASAAQPGDLATEDLMIAVLVDNAFIAPAQRQQVLDSLGERLEPLLHGGNRVLLALRDQGLSVEQTFTSDPREIRQAISSLADRPGLGTQVATRRLSLRRQIGAGTRRIRNEGLRGGIDLARIDATSLWREVQSYAQDLLQEVRTSTAAVATLLESLAGMPGRKAILYVCDRLPLYPGEPMIETWYAKYGDDYGAELGVSTPEIESRKNDAGKEIEALIAEAGASRVAFFPLVSGESATGITLESSDAGSAGGNAVSSFNTAGELSANRLGLAALAADSQGLEQLAHGTGGATATGRGGVDNLLRGLQSELSHYYSLAYPSPHGGDGKTHNVEVRVHRPGARVSFPRTYRDKNPDQQMLSRTLAALLLGSGENPLGIQIILGDPKPRGKGLFAIPLRVEFPLANLALLPREATHVGDVSVFLVLRDEKGRITDPSQVKVPVEIPNPELLRAMASTGRYRTELLLRPGKQTLAVGLRDGFGATSSTVRIPFEIDKGSS